jgi:hypothetical protein
MLTVECLLACLPVRVRLGENERIERGLLYSELQYPVCVALLFSNQCRYC